MLLQAHLGSSPPQNPTSVNPTSVNPTSVNPTSVNPTSVNPTSVNSDSVNPDSVNPDSVNSDLVNPGSVNPDAVNPTSATSEQSTQSRGTFWLLPAASVGKGVRVTGQVLIRGLGKVEIGDGVVLDAAAAPIELNATAGARIELGQDVYVGPGASLEAGALISIGQGAAIGAHAKILDNNWHQTVGDRQTTPPSSPVHVGAGAIVGARATILRGGSLGAGSQLGADSVLSRRVPAGMTVSGIPARPAGVRAGQPAVAEDSGSHGLKTAVPFPEISDETRKVGLPTMLFLSLLEWVRRLKLPRLLRHILARAELACAWAIARQQLRTARMIGQCYSFGPLDVANNGHLSIGDRAIFRGGPVRTKLELRRGAELRIGEGTIINYGVHIRADDQIQIGSQCLIGSRVLILDQLGDLAGPVVIEDDVWLAHGVTVLPGVRIGKGAAVSAGVTVDRDVPPNSMAVGHPMRSQPLSVLSSVQ